MINPNFPQSHNEFELVSPQTIVWPEIPSTIEAANEHQQLMENLLSTNGWDPEEAYQIGYAFQEILKNAIVHGNLEIERVPGESEEDWPKTVATVSKLEKNRDKTVAVKIILAKRKIVIEIQDQGKNSKEFWKNKNERMRTGSDTVWKSGRGVQISEAFLNQVSYEKNEAGVKAILIRDLDVPIITRV